MRRVWKHKAHVFKEDGAWWWVCLRNDCQCGTHPSHATVLYHALNHAFLGGYTWT